MLNIDDDYWWLIVVHGDYWWLIVIHGDRWWSAYHMLHDAMDRQRCHVVARSVMVNNNETSPSITNDGHQAQLPEVSPSNIFRYCSRRVSWLFATRDGLAAAVRGEQLARKSVAHSAGLAATLLQLSTAISTANPPREGLTSKRIAEYHQLGSFCSVGGQWTPKTKEAHLGPPGAFLGQAHQVMNSNLPIDWKVQPSMKQPGVGTAQHPLMTPSQHHRRPPRVSLTGGLQPARLAARQKGGEQLAKGYTKSWYRYSVNVVCNSLLLVNKHCPILILGCNNNSL